MHHPFFFRNDINIYVKETIKSIATIPFLRQHISIVPHIKVDTHKHHYSYSSTGSDIAFHSKGEILPYKIARLSDFLKDILENAFTNHDSWLSFEEIIENLKIMAKDHNLKTLKSDSEAPIQYLRDFGREIYSKYGIKQYLFLAQKEEISRIK